MHLPNCVIATGKQSHDIDLPVSNLHFFRLVTAHLSSQRAVEARAAALAAIGEARSPRVRDSSTNHPSIDSKAGHLGVGETWSRFSEREEGGRAQVRFVTLERSRWREVLSSSVPP